MLIERNSLGNKEASQRLAQNFYKIYPTKGLYPEYKMGTIENITYSGICLILEPDNGVLIENSHRTSFNTENSP